MGTLTINGQKVQVDDSFARLSPQEQEATVNEIARQIGVTGEQPPSPAPAPSQAGPEPTAPTPTQPPAQDQSFMDKVLGTVDAFTSGAVGGLGPQMTGIEAGLLGRTPEGGWFDYSKSFGERYEAARDAERSQMEKFSETNPLLSIGGKVGGFVAGAPMMVERAAVKAAPKLLASTMPRRIATNTAASAAVGATDALGEGRDVAEGAKTGAMLGPVGQVAGELMSATGGKLIASIRRNAKNLDLSQLRQIENEGFEAFKNSGVVYKPQAFKQLKQRAFDRMRDYGFNAAAHPQVNIVLKEVQKLAEGKRLAASGKYTKQPIDARAAEALRSLITDRMKAGKGKENAMLAILRDELYDTLGNRSAAIVGHGMSGNEVGKAYRALKLGVDMSNRRFKMERVTRFVDALKRSTTGMNDEGVRRIGRSMLKSEKFVFGMTAGEKAALEKMISGGSVLSPRNVLGMIGSFRPSKNSVRLAMAGVGTWANPALAVPAIAITEGAEKGANVLARKSVNDLMKLIGGTSRFGTGGIPRSATGVEGLLTSPQARLLMGMANTGGILETY